MFFLFPTAKIRGPDHCYIFNDLLVSFEFAKDSHYSGIAISVICWMWQCYGRGVVVIVDKMHRRSTCPKRKWMILKLPPPHLCTRAVVVTARCGWCGREVPLRRPVYKWVLFGEEGLYSTVADSWHTMPQMSAHVWNMTCENLNHMTAQHACIKTGIDCTAVA